MRLFFRKRPEIAAILAAQGILLLFVFYLLLVSDSQTAPSPQAEGKSSTIRVENSARPEKGERAPDFTLKSTSGSIALSDYLGKKVLLEFVATWCPYCNKMAPRVKQATSKEKVDLLLVSAAGESPSQVKKWSEKFFSGAKVGYDSSGKILSNYDVVGTPTFVLIDERGLVEDYFVGELSVQGLRNKIAEK